jgi:hypothetical protein
MDTKKQTQTIPKKVYLYIDGDNQSSTLAQDLLNKIDNIIDTPSELYTYIFCNHLGVLENWESELSDFCKEINPTFVPFVKNAADLTLVMTVGFNIQKHIDNYDTVIIVSRDQMLINFANLLSEQDLCKIYLAFDENITVSQLFKKLKVIKLKRNGTNKNNVFRDLILTIYKECTQKYNNKCDKSHFCERLNQLGYKKSERKQILKHPIVYEYIENGKIYIKIKTNRNLRLS